MRRSLKIGFICELCLASLSLAILIAAAVIGAPGLAIAAGLVSAALIYIAVGFLYEHYRPGCRYFDWAVWFWCVFCVKTVWQKLCVELIWRRFCVKTVWKKFCVNTVYGKLRENKNWLYISPMVLIGTVATVLLLFVTTRLASSKMFFWIAVYASCVICLALDGLLVKKSDTELAEKKKSSRDQRIIYLVVITALAVIAGLRNVGGTDYNIYRTIYNNVPTLGDFFRHYTELDDRYVTFGVERAFVFVNSLFKTLHVSYYGYIFVQAVFIVFATYFALRRYTGEFMLVVLVFLYKFYFYNVFISLRQPITIAIFFIMLRLMEKRKLVWYMLLGLVAFSFHTAAIILFPLYFLNRLKLSRRLIIILNVIFLPTLVLSAMDVPVLSVLEPVLNLDVFATDEIFLKAEHLILGESLTSINWLHTAEYYILMVLLIFFYNQIREANPESDTMIKLFLCLLPIFTLCRNYEILTRIKDYFTISYGFIIVYIANIGKGKYRFITYTLTTLWCAFGFLRFISLFDGGAMLRYMPNIFLGRSLFE